MAQSERFYFWRDYYDALKLLNDPADQAALIMGICEYAFEGEEPDFGDNPAIRLAWTIVRNQVRESVEMGRRQSERGSLGGRPRKGQKTTAKSGAKSGGFSGGKSGAKTTALSGVKSGAESGAETTAESGAESVREGKGKECNGFLSLPGKDGGLRAPAVAGATPPVREQLYNEYGEPVDERGNILGPSIYPPEPPAPYYGDAVPMPVRPSGLDGG